MKILLISFDIQKPGHPQRNLAMGNIVSAWRKEVPNGIVEHLSIDIRNPAFDFSIEMNKLQIERDISTVNFIAFQVAVWSKEYVQKVLKMLPIWGFTGEMILGGYEITGRDFNSLKNTFPGANYFVQGYGEPALKEIFDSHFSGKTKACLINNTDLTDPIPSPYLDGSIPLYSSIKTANIETKRGCPFSCNYCAHDTVHMRKIIEKPVHEVLKEIECMVKNGVKRINIIDPVFNSGKNFFKIAKYISKLEAPTVFTLQYRLRPKMREFLELCKKGNIILEIGIQSLDSNVLHNINRHDDPNRTLELLREVLDFVPFELSLIYGLPGQTAKSFEETILKLRAVTQNPIRAYPLMLLPGTQLYNEKERWDYIEGIDELGIPYVKESGSFSASDWERMDHISKKLG